MYNNKTTTLNYIEDELCVDETNSKDLYQRLLPVRNYLIKVLPRKKEKRNQFCISLDAKMRFVENCFVRRNLIKIFIKLEVGGNLNQ